MEQNAELPEYQRRVLAFDAAPLLADLLERGRIVPTKRYQALTVNDVLPPIRLGSCACGCGQLILPPRRKWASDECAYVPYEVLDIIRGNTELIGKYLRLTHGRHCQHCQRTHDERGLHLRLECDHIVPVAEGGAGRWLDNYQLLCERCHKVKTAAQARAKALARRKAPLFQ